jgi:hypothetical protein
LDRHRITVREIEKLGRSAIDSNELFIENLEVGDNDVVDDDHQNGGIQAAAKHLGAEAGLA